MPASNTPIHDIQTYELTLAHSDIIDMMNQISLAGGGLDSSLQLEVAIRRVSGAEIVVQDGFDDTMVLVLRFRATTDTPSTTTFSGITINP